MISSEILASIAQKIHDTELGEQFMHAGEVVEVKDGVATVSGLSGAHFGEIVAFEQGIQGLVLDLLPHAIGVLILGEQTAVAQGQKVTATGKMFSMGVGQATVGRVLNAL